MKKIPVTILAGFLGAGKTTLLNALLKQYPGKKIQIIENEFGSENIDGKLIRNSETITEITNGCICCSSADEFSSALFNFLDSKALPEHLIVETTGIANPETLIKLFLCDYQLASAFEINAVITLIDSIHLDGAIHQRPEVAQQLKCADVVALTKTDIADSYQIETSLNICRRMNPEAKILLLKNGNAQTDIDWLNLKIFNASNVLNYIQVNSEKPVQTQWHGTIKKMVLQESTPLDILKFDTWIKSILHFPDFNLYRLKGYLYFEDLPDKLIIQAVQDIYQTESGGKWNEQEEKKSILVLIGEGLDSEKISKTFSLCTISNEYVDYSGFCENLERILTSN
jgi:G3E family GTPase